MGKKIGILTFHASHNYGSMLLAYAMQHCLQELGHEPVIINLRNDAQKEMYRKPKPENVKGWIKFMLFPRKFMHNRKKWLSFEKFMKDHYVLTDNEYRGKEEISEDLPNLHLDCLLSAGDQIWNQRCYDWDLSYLLPFHNVGTELLSYAPSLGGDVSFMMSLPYADMYKLYLPKFKKIGVREHDGAMALGRLLDLEISVMPDPVFLNGVDVYEDLSGDMPLQKGKYLFYYSPWDSVEMFNLAKQYADSRRLTMVATNVGYLRRDVVAFNYAGPREFLNLLRNAEFVCGNSFHLAVFAILFHKEFAVLHQGKDSRLADLLGTFGIPSRGVSVDNPDFSKLEPIDYAQVDKVVSDLRTKGRDFLVSLVS